MTYRMIKNGHFGMTMPNIELQGGFPEEKSFRAASMTKTFKDKNVVRKGGSDGKTNSHD